MTVFFAEKPKYIPNLNELQSQCEINYYLLMKVWPCLNQVNLKSNTNKVQINTKIHKLAIQNEIINLLFSITDIAPYTTTMNLTIVSPKLSFNHCFELIIRLYHDVKMLEVMEGSGPSALKAIYNFKLNNLKPVDEKRQVNRFLGECLKAVLQ